MATREHLKRQNLRKVQDKPFGQEEIALELLPEFIPGQTKFDEDIARADNVIDITEPTDKEIKDREAKVDRNQFGTIELTVDSPRRFLDIPLTTDRITLKSIHRVVATDAKFEHFALRI
tara:strand:+ start:694 stop:1050 length:357 start_codon:yes stop_codon:yes gene_type:complete